MDNGLLQCLGYVHFFLIVALLLASSYCNAVATANGPEEIRREDEQGSFWAYVGQLRQSPQGGRGVGVPIHNRDP